MDSKVKLYLERAENELVLANASFELSVKDDAKEILKVPKGSTFFNNVISQSYYSIFYCAKAYLVVRGIETKPPEEHKKTYEEFKKIVLSKQLDKELLEIYEDAMIKANTLLKIFKKEKWKRGHFTYHINASANMPVAKKSLENAKKFVSNIMKILESGDKKEIEKVENENSK